MSYICDKDPQQIQVFLRSHTGDHGVSVHGDYAPDGVLKSITGSPRSDQFSGHGTLNLDVIASTTIDGRFSRIDLAGSNDGDTCSIEGVITPSTGINTP